MATRAKSWSETHAPPRVAGRQSTPTRSEIRRRILRGWRSDWGDVNYGCLVIPGLYHLFGTISDKHKFIKDEIDEPLSESFDNEA